MRKIEVKIRQIIWAFFSSFNITNYDEVLYNGKKYYVKSSLTGLDKWSLYTKQNVKPVYYSIKGKDLKLKNNITRFLKVFEEKMYFQVSNWQSIDLRNPLGTRLSYYNSENIMFYKRVI